MTKVRNTFMRDRSHQCQESDTVHEEEYVRYRYIYIPQQYRDLYNNQAELEAR